jgi:hypothetical protein
MKEKFLEICNRIYDLIIKFISVKGVVFGIGSALALTGHIGEWTWFAVSLLMVSVRAFEKWVSAKTGL